MDLEFIRDVVNPEKLRYEVEVVADIWFMDLVIGGTKPGELHVYVAENTPPATVDLIGQVVAAHDPYTDEEPPGEEPPKAPAEITEQVFEMESVNAELLHQELQAAVAAVTGVSVRGKQVRVHLDASQVKNGDGAKIAPVIVAHDASKTTPSQDKAEARAQLVASLDKPWDEWTEQDKDTLLKLIADSMIGLP